MGRDMHGAVLDRNRNFLRRSEFQLAFCAFDSDRLTVELGGDAGRDDDGLLADTGHCSKSVCSNFASSEDGAKNLAANIVLASGMVGHHTLRRRYDRNTQAVGDPG